MVGDEAVSVVVNDVGDVVLTNPKSMLVLADRDRLALLELLRRHGPATTAELSAASGAGVASIDADLHLLAEVGLVVDHDAPGDARRWEAIGKGLYFEIPTDPEGQAAARKLASVMLQSYDDVPRRWVVEDEPRLELEWCQSAGLLNARVMLTPAELRDLQAQFERLLQPYLNRGTEHGSAEGRQVRILSYFLPEARSGG